MDGTNRKELHSSDILHIFGLTLLGEHLYWTDMQRRSLDRINKITGKILDFFSFVPCSKRLVFSSLFASLTYANMSL